MYSLPGKRGNPNWPMPRDYELPEKSWKPGCCNRCSCSLGKGKNLCENCREFRKQCRLELLTSWYDPNKPGEVMSDKKLFVIALNYFVKFYFKESPQCSHQYFMPDCKHKPTMQEMFTHSRSALVAPRESGKTFTIVYELVPFICITRPNTPILIGSETKDLTEEKLKEIRLRVEASTRIYADFGLVWPKSRTSVYEWSHASCLDFLNGSNVKGSSVGQATRGRHPLVGLIDDPEGKGSRAPKWRKEFMEWLFRDYLNQFRDKGTHVMWVGTILRKDSCLWRAIHNEDEEKRFITWERKILPQIYEDPPGSGNLVSAWPEKLSVADFDAKKKGVAGSGITAIGMAATMAEFQGQPIPDGDLMFQRKERTHGYVWCKNQGVLSIYDPLTEEFKALSDLVAECKRFGAVDVADGTSANDDPSAIVIGLYDSDGVIWWIDAWEKRCFSDATAVKAMQMAHEWKVYKMYWESVSLGRRIYREAFKLRQQRLRDGFHAPILIPLKTDGIPKELRIERMKPMFDDGKMKFPLMYEIDGVEPIKRQSSSAFRSLLDQVDTMTMEGTAGHDDLLDACEMLHRNVDRRPKAAGKKTRGRRNIEKLNRVGIEVNPIMVPERDWTPEMKTEFERRIMPEQVFTKPVDAFS